MSDSDLIHNRQVIVVGGGPAGLIAAARLARAGAQTTLLESGSSLGGRSASKRQGGFDLNQGPHALSCGGAAIRELHALGIDPAGWSPVSLRNVLVRGGRARRLPGATVALTRWLAGVLRGREDAVHELTVQQWLARTLPDADARASASAVVRVATYASDHDLLSADVALGQLRLVLHGVRYVRGGWATIVSALEARARGGGAEISLRAPVRAVRESSQGGWSVVLDDRELHADLVVVAAGEHGDCASLLGDRAPEAPGPAAEVSTLDLGLRSLPAPSRRFGLGIDEPYYISRHSPPGHPDGALMTAMRYGRGPRSSLDAFVDVVQPGWRRQLTFERFLPRMVAVSAIATPASGGLRGRPAVDQGDGLYVCGDWVGPEGWLLDAALCSGAAAADAAIGAVHARPEPAVR